MSRHIRRRVKAGVEEFCCTTCKEWKGRPAFYSGKVSYGRPFGLRTGLCKDCHNVKRRVYVAANRDHTREVSLMRHRRLRHEAREADKIRKRSKPAEFLPKMVEREKVLPIVEALLANNDGDLGMAAHQAGTTARTLYAIRTGERPTMRWEMAERLALCAGMHEDFINQFPIAGKDGWSTKGDRYCRHCGRWDVAHCALGYCIRCYQTFRLKRRDGKPMKAQPMAERWMRTDEFIACIRCKRRDMRHKGHGLCTSCYHLVTRDAVLDGERYRIHIAKRRSSDRPRGGD